MASSKIAISNIALALLGEDSIRSFEEKNKRARMCDRVYDMTKDWLLVKFDWPFARNVKTLQEISEDMTDAPILEGWTTYQKPNDCRVPRDILPYGSRTRWTTMGNYILVVCDVDEPQLAFTKQAIDVGAFSDSFSNLLSLGMAVKMSPALTQDNTLTNALGVQFIQEQREAWEADANIGNIYREFDETPENDSFVSPDVRMYGVLGIDAEKAR